MVRNVREHGIRLARLATFSARRRLSRTAHSRQRARCRSPSPSASCVISCFQSSMLLHNLSSVFSLGRKTSQRTRRGSRVPHQRPPRRGLPQAHTKPHPAACPTPRRSPVNRPAPRRSPANRPAPRHSPASLPRTGPIPRRGRFSTEFSTFLPVSHSGFLSPWLSWRETASDLLSRGFFLQRKTRYGTVLYGTVRYGAA